MKSLIVIGGLDPTGHAGILRDVGVAQSLKIPTHTLITALTYQNDKAYFGHTLIAPKALKRSWACVPHKEVGAVKIGMLGSLGIVKALVEWLKELKRVNKNVKVVWDPVFASSSGGMLLAPNAIRWAVKNLTPLCDLVTPNANEISCFVKSKAAPEFLCDDFWQKYEVPLYLKGGHLRAAARDWLCDGECILILDGKKSRKKVRGTGCFLATAIACGLSQGKPLRLACQIAKEMMQKEF